jgi:glycerol uptake facilitator protein
VGAIGLCGAIEHAQGIIRGLPGSQRSAMVYTDYLPNPALLGVSPAAFAAVSLTQASLAEGIDIALLLFFIFALTDTRNPDSPGSVRTPLFIGLAVAIIMSIVSPLSQAGLNPARDFGPRLFVYLAGRGAIAIPGPRGGFLQVYLLAPLLGGLAGAGIYQYVVHNRHPSEKMRPLKGLNG